MGTPLLAESILYALRRQQETEDHRPYSEPGMAPVEIVLRRNDVPYAVDSGSLSFQHGFLVFVSETTTFSFARRAVVAASLLVCAFTSQWIRIVPWHPPTHGKLGRYSGPGPVMWPHSPAALATWVSIAILLFVFLTCIPWLQWRRIAAGLAQLR